MKIKLNNKDLKLIKLKIDKIKAKSSLKRVKEIKLYTIYYIFIIHILIENIFLINFEIYFTAINKLKFMLLILNK